MIKNVYKIRKEIFVCSSSTGFAEKWLEIVLLSLQDYWKDTEGMFDLGDRCHVFKYVSLRIYL